MHRLEGKFKFVNNFLLVSKILRNEENSISLYQAKDSLLIIDAELAAPYDVSNHKVIRLSYSCMLELYILNICNNGN